MNVAYPLLPVFVLTILAYLTTWVFTRWGILSFRSYRKSWNYLLLISFLISGSLGLFSVIKINYNLEVKGYEQLLRWHVSFGIAMALIAIIHLSWHLKYYFSGINQPIQPIDTSVKEKLLITDHRARYLLFALGMITLINQSVFIREIVSFLGVNELVIGLVMACWLLLTGWGAYSGRSKTTGLVPLNWYALILTVTSLLPIVLIGLLYWLKSQLFPPGTSVGAAISLLGTGILLFPVCFLSGYLFVGLSGMIAPIHQKEKGGLPYSIESLGSMAGGLLFSFVLGRLFTSLRLVAITSALLIIILIFLFNKRRFYWIGGLTALLVPLLIFMVNPDIGLKKLILPNQSILLNKSTSYGNLTVTSQAGQLNIYENNELLFDTGNRQQCEEAVHFAMLQHNHPLNVLLLSGSMAGMVKEIEKYSVEKIICLEPNPELFDELKDTISPEFKSPNVMNVKEDIRRFLSLTHEVYDVIVINLPPPATLAYNRFYSLEFFNLVKKHCARGSVLITSLPSTFNYAGDEALRVNGSLWKTLCGIFGNRQLIMGEKNYYVVSDSTVSPYIAALSVKRGIKNDYVNPYYINDTLQIQKSDSLIVHFDKRVSVNHDFHPFIFLNQINQWLSLWKINYWILVAIPALLFLFIGFRQSSLSMGLYAGGFTSASLEMVLLIAFQLYFGTLYRNTALFFAFFMGGLALGSFITLFPSSPPSYKQFGKVQFGLALFALILPLFIHGLNLSGGNGVTSQLLLFLFTLILSFITGQEYQLAMGLRKENRVQSAGENYSIDLVGSAFGAFLTTMALFPLLGLTFTCIIVAVLNIISGNIAYFHRRN